jgi:hypothetical protein
MLTSCNHDTLVCPKGYDCNSFCDICEGESEYCPTCDEYAKNQAETYLGMYANLNNEG